VELEDVRDILAALSVTEVIVQPVVDEAMDPPTAGRPSSSCVDA
jgi:hypothetical protein